MKKRSLLFKGTILLLMFFVGLSTINSQTLMHSYTFEDGTYDASYVRDQVGNLDGTFMGTGTIVDGVYTVNSDNDYISFDGTALALNSYESISIEVFVTAGDAQNESWTMLTYFGGTNGDNTYWMAIARGNDLSTTSYEGGAGVDTEELEDGQLHHLVSILTGTSISFYVDGIHIGTASHSKPISDIKTDYAELCHGAWGNPAWYGSVHEFNIYEGELDAEIIKTRAADFLGIDMTDATLANLSSDLGSFDPEFSPSVDEYELMVPYGTTKIQLDWQTTVEAATVNFYDGQGNLMDSQDGNIEWTGDGIDFVIGVLSMDQSVENFYYISVFLDPAAENADLSDIQLSTGHLTADFDAQVYEYIAIVPNGTETVDVTGVPAWEGAQVEGNGTVTLTDGAGSATLIVTSQDGNNTESYMITVYESDLKSSMEYYIEHEESGYVIEGQSLSYIKLQSAVKSSSSQLFTLEDSGVEGQYFLKNQNNEYITLTKATVSTWDMLMTDELTGDQDSCRFAFEEFDPGKFRILTVARKDNEEGKFYLGTNDNNSGTSIYSDKPMSAAMKSWILREPEYFFPTDAYLTALSIDGATVKPAFDPSLTDYYVTLPVNATSAVINATPEDETTNVVGAGTIDFTEDSGIFTITATTEDQQHTKDYNIHYIVDTELTLMHSYSFADGTVRDMKGTADGLVNGGYIENGNFVSAGDGGYITLPADEIAINEYPSITLEAYVKAGANSGWSMLTYFGGLSGYKSYWMSVQNNDNYTRAVIDEWQGAYKAETLGEAEAGFEYHYVSTLTNDSISLYINGNLVQKTLIHEDYYINDLSIENAWIGYGGYNDPIWIGEVYEFNIYSGEMDEVKVLEKYNSFPSEDATTDATLSSLTIDGEIIEGFHSAILEYDVMVEEGTNPVIDATVKVEGATYQVNSPDAIPGLGTVVVTAADGETSITYTINFDTATGIGKGVKESNVKIYPTISSGEFTVEVNGQSSTITVFDLSGRLVNQVETNNKREVISIENRGMYILKVNVDGETELFKVIKK